MHISSILSIISSKVIMRVGRLNSSRLGWSKDCHGWSHLSYIMCNFFLWHWSAISNRSNNIRSSFPYLWNNSVILVWSIQGKSFDISCSINDIYRSDFAPSHSAKSLLINQQSVIVILCCEDPYKKCCNDDNTNATTTRIPTHLSLYPTKHSQVWNPFFAKCFLVKGESNE